ncbi:MAG: lysostaphin resistance A-like protein [Planctomycetota bacterium]
MIALLLLLAGVAAWALKAVPREAAVSLGSGSDPVKTLGAQWQTGGGRVVAAALALLALGALASAAATWPRALRTLRALLRGEHGGAAGGAGGGGQGSVSPLARPAGPALALLLVCYGAVFVVAGMVSPLFQLGAPAPELVLRTPDASPRTIPLRPLRPLALGVLDGQVAPVPSGAALVIRLESVGAELELRPGTPLSLAVEGQAVDPGPRVRVAPGAALDLTGPGVPPTRCELRGPTWRHVLPGLTVGMALGLGAALLVLVALTRTRGPSSASPAALGVHLRGWRHELLRGLVGYLAALPLFFGALLLTQALAKALGTPAEHHPLILALERDHGLALWVVLSAAVVAPLSEELLFRGLLFTGLRQAWARPLPALLGQAFLFAAIHPGFSHLLPMLVLGGLFGYLRLTSPTGSLLGSVVAHTLHNGLTLAFTLAVLLG